ncbi:MAG TPA: phasin family protein [Aliidongia sp.]|nr:phasin family protein [Aliidongia sp.]
MTGAPVEPATKPNPAALGKGSSAVRQNIPTELEAPATSADLTAQTMFGAYNLNKGGNAVVTGFQDLIQAYQAIARRNTEKLTASMQALAAARTPKDFVELQQKLLTESVAAAVSDSATIGKLTTAAFTAAFEPMREHIGDLRAGAKRQE